MRMYRRDCGRRSGWPISAIMMMGSRHGGWGESWRWDSDDGPPRGGRSGRGPRGRMFAGGELRLVLLRLIGGLLRRCIVPLLRLRRLVLVFGCHPTISLFPQMKVSW